jgi:glycerol transport system ATP-binding protein
MNLLPCTVKDGTAYIDDVAMPLSDRAKAALGQITDGVTLGIRPEFVECLPVPQADAAPAMVLSVRNMGTHYLGEFKLGKRTVSAKLRNLSATPGSTVWLRFPAERTLFYVNDKRVA